jgi:predicted lysophospholipase L1 biosynthesis ABC-type transport system permease subunit
MRIPVLEGRGIEVQDDASAPRTLVVNSTFAEKYWPGATAIGKRVRVGDEWSTVVGVVAPSRFRSLTESPAPFFYLPVLQNYSSEATFQVRTNGDPVAAARQLRDAIQSAAPQLVIYNVATLEERTAPATFHQRAAGATLSVFGGLALVLASVGIAGVLAFAVANRTREFGVRMALGADRRRVLVLVLWEAARLVGVGIALGLVIAIGASRLLDKMLVGVGALDPVAFCGATAFLAVVAMAACLGPARRAASVDPIEALKSE